MARDEIAMRAPTHIIAQLSRVRIRMRSMRSDIVREQLAKRRAEALAQKVSKMRGKLRTQSADGTSDVVALAPHRRTFMDHESKE